MRDVVLGIDVVVIGRLKRVLDGSPRVIDRLFTELEIEYCSGRRHPDAHFAGTLAAKEAVVKALRLGPLIGWARRIEIVRDRAGAPRAIVAARDEQRYEIPVSISHDGPVAVAVSLNASPVIRHAVIKRSRGG